MQLNLEIERISKEIYEKTMNTVAYGRTLREWMKTIAAYERASGITRCGNCAHYSESEKKCNLEGGIALKLLPIDYCSHGEYKASKEDEDEQN